VSLRTPPLPRFRAHARARVCGLAPATLLALAVLALSSCGGSSKGLIPLANAGPLKSDFEEVSRAARSGNGDCTATSAAIAKTEQDFSSLPGTIDAGLRKTLSEGIENLRERALALCAQPLTQTTATSTTTTPAHAHLAPTTSPKTAPTTSTPTTTPAPSQGTTPSNTPPANSTPNNGGGTAAPSGPAGEAAPGSGRGTENSESESAGERAGGQEAGK
jgi:hypothetical protein